MTDTRVIGIDLGGTKILAGVIDRSGRVESQVARPTPDDSQESVVDALVETVEELRTEGIAAVGLGVPGRIDPRSGLVFGAVNTRLENIRLGEVMEERLGMPAR